MPALKYCNNYYLRIILKVVSISTKIHVFECDLAKCSFRGEGPWTIPRLKNLTCSSYARSFGTFNFHIFLIEPVL